MKNIKTILTITFSLLTNLCAEQNTNIDFINSFISHYEFNAEGRYAHEYHPFLLDQTAKSLDKLEDYLHQKDFNMSGRIVICGYEEQAVPTYYTDYKKPKICDEASIKNYSGWSMRLHNKFGFMTGFLFKDVEYFNNRWFKNSESVFEHINADKIEIFDDKAVIFQQHAFGEGVGLVYNAQIDILRAIKNQDCKEAFERLISFWKDLYEYEIKSDGKQIVGTQDIFFSIENAKHLVRSQLPFLKYYMGPDITYPIEVSLKQEKGATEHSQRFSKIFVENLKSINEKPTVYIFCSFVDGVGKTTLLGNVQNRLKFGDQIEKFERVDNSSSQLATVFKVRDNLFIADLPAQVSHFTYKPDGFVYAPVSREMEQEQIDKVVQFVKSNQQRFIDEYENNLYYGGVGSGPGASFIKNLILLKKVQANKWIPFEFGQDNYLFNSQNVEEIRILKQLGSVQSEGLKNIESEQMLFSQGVRLPMPYQYFLDDLIFKLKEHEIENVVMVDFISMYPRSSRENIRINYLLQQLALIDQNFDTDKSLYKEFESDSELLYCLNQRDFKEESLRALYNETLMRLAIYKFVIEKNEKGIDGLSIEQLTQLIQSEMKKFSIQDQNFLQGFLIDKVNSAQRRLERSYGLSKSFVNVHMFSFEKLHSFSRLLIKFLNKSNIQNIFKSSFSFWEDIDYCQEKTAVSGLFDSNCKDAKSLAPFFRLLRSCWYATFSNLLLDKNEKKFLVPPLWMTKTKDNKFVLWQKNFKRWEEEKLPTGVAKIKKFFNLIPSKKGKWGKHKKDAIRLDWQSPATNKGIYAFNCDMTSTKKLWSSKTITTFLVSKYQKKHGADTVMPTSKLYKKLTKSKMWQKHWKSMLEKAKKNGYKGKKKDQDSEDKNKKSKWYRKSNKNKIKIYLARNDQKAAARLFVRFIATLEMLLKDPDSDVVVRFGHKKDFKFALLLLEKVTLPKFFGLVFEKGLFDDYDGVEPVMELW